MADEDLNIKVDVTIDEAKKELDKLEKDLKNTAKEIEKTSKKTGKAIGDSLAESKREFDKKEKLIKGSINKIKSMEGISEKEKTRRLKRHYKELQTLQKQHNKKQEQLLTRALRESQKKIAQAQSKIAAQTRVKGGAGAFDARALLRGGGIMGALPQVAAIGGVIMGIKSLGNALSEMAEKSRVVESKMAFIKTLLDPSEFAYLDDIAVKAEKASLATGQSMEVILQGVYQVLSAGAATADTVGDFMLEVSKFATALGADVESSALAVGGFLNALGWGADRAGEAMDVLSMTMRKGVIPSGEALAQYMPIIAKNMQDIGLSADQYGAAVATMTGAGIQLPESITMLKAFGAELKNTASISKLMAIEGIEGFDEQKRAIVDLEAFSHSLRETYVTNKNVIIDAFGSIEAKQAANILLNPAEGQGLLHMWQTSFDGVAGAMEAMWSRVASSQEMEVQRTTQRWESVSRNIGGFWAEIESGFNRMVLSIFETSEERALMHFARLDELKAQQSAISKTLERGAEITVQPWDQEAANAFYKSLENITEQLSDMGPAGALAADRIAEIVESSEQATPEGLVQINEELGIMQERLLDLAGIEAIKGIDESVQEEFINIGLQLEKLNITFEDNVDQFVGFVRYQSLSAGDAVKNMFTLISDGSGKMVADLMDQGATAEGVVLGLHQGAEETRQVIEGVEEQIRKAREAGAPAEEIEFMTRLWMGLTQGLAQAEVQLDKLYQGIKSSAEATEKIGMDEDYHIDRLLAASKITQGMADQLRDRLNTERLAVQEEEKRQAIEESLNQMLSERLDLKLLGEQEALIVLRDEQLEQERKYKELSQIRARAASMDRTEAELYNVTKQKQLEATDKIMALNKRIGQLARQQVVTEEQIQGLIQKHTIGMSDIVKTQDLQIQREKLLLQAKLEGLKRIRQEIIAKLNSVKASVTDQEAQQYLADAHLEINKIIEDRAAMLDAIARGEYDVKMSVTAADIETMSKEEIIGQLEQELANVDEEIKSTESALGKLGGALDKAGSSAGGAAGEVNKLKNALAELDQQIEDVQFEISMIGVEGVDKALAEEERRYQKHLEELRNEFGDNQEIISKATELHQVKLTQIQTEEVHRRYQEEMNQLKQFQEEAKRRWEEIQRHKTETDIKNMQKAVKSYRDWLKTSSEIDSFIRQRAGQRSLNYINQLNRQELKIRADFEKEILRLKTALNITNQNEVNQKILKLEKEMLLQISELWRENVANIAEETLNTMKNEWLEMADALDVFREAIKDMSVDVGISFEKIVRDAISQQTLQTEAALESMQGESRSLLEDLIDEMSLTLFAGLSFEQTRRIVESELSKILTGEAPALFLAGKEAPITTEPVGRREEGLTARQLLHEMVTLGYDISLAIKMQATHQDEQEKLVVQLTKLQAVGGLNDTFQAIRDGYYTIQDFREALDREAGHIPLVVRKSLADAVEGFEFESADAIMQIEELHEAAFNELTRLMSDITPNTLKAVIGLVNESIDEANKLLEARGLETKPLLQIYREIGSERIDMQRTFNELMKISAESVPELGVDMDIMIGRLNDMRRFFVAAGIEFGEVTLGNFDQIITSVREQIVNMEEAGERTLKTVAGLLDQMERLQSGEGLQFLETENVTEVIDQLRVLGSIMVGTEAFLSPEKQLQAINMMITDLTSVADAQGMVLTTMGNALDMIAEGTDASIRKGAELLNLTDSLVRQNEKYSESAQLSNEALSQSISDLKEVREYVKEVLAQERDRLTNSEDMTEEEMKRQELTVKGYEVTIEAIDKKIQSEEKLIQNSAQYTQMVFEHFKQLGEEADDFLKLINDQELSMETIEENYVKINTDLNEQISLYKALIQLSEGNNDLQKEYTDLLLKAKNTQAEMMGLALEQYRQQYDLQLLIAEEGTEGQIAAVWERYGIERDAEAERYREGLISHKQFLEKRNQLYQKAIDEIQDIEQEATTQTIQSIEKGVSFLADGISAVFDLIQKEGDITFGDVTGMIGDLASNFGMVGDIVGGIIGTIGGIVDTISDSIDGTEIWNESLERNQEFLVQANEILQQALESINNIERLGYTVGFQDRIDELKDGLDDALSVYDTGIDALSVANAEAMDVFFRDAKQAQEILADPAAFDEWVRWFLTEDMDFDSWLGDWEKYIEPIKEAITGMSDGVVDMKVEIQDLSMEAAKFFIDYADNIDELLALFESDLGIRLGFNKMVEVADAFINKMGEAPLTMEELTKYAREVNEYLKEMEKRAGDLNEEELELIESIRERFDKQFLEGIERAYDLEAKRIEIERQIVGEKETELKLIDNTIDMLRRQLREAKKRGMSEEDILDITIELNNALIDRSEIVADSAMEVHDSELDELEHRKKMGEFDTNEAEYLRQKKEILKAMLRIAIMHNIPIEERWKLEEEIADIIEQQTKRLENQVEIVDDLQQIIWDNIQFTLDELEHRKKMGEFDTDEAEYLRLKREILEEMLQIAIDNNFPIKERWKLEEDIVNIIEQQTESLKEQADIEDDLLDNLWKRHNALVENARLLDLGLDPKQLQDLMNVEEEIIQRMRELGMDEATIQQALQAFQAQKSFQEGGRVESDMLAWVDKGEEIITAPTVSSLESILPGFIESLRGDNTPRDIKDMITSFEKGHNYVIYKSIQVNQDIAGDNNNFNIYESKNARETATAVAVVSDKVFWEKWQRVKKLYGGQDETW